VREGPAPEAGRDFREVRKREEKEEGNHESMNGKGTGERRTRNQIPRTEADE
jgi:hypothetical protein